MELLPREHQLTHQLYITQFYRNRLNFIKIKTYTSSYPTGDPAECRRPTEEQQEGRKRAAQAKTL